MRIIIIITLATFTFCFPACKPRNTLFNNPAISTGKTVPVAQQIISTHGGKFEVNKPGDPINGLIIDIPNSSYKDDRKFTISYAEIKDHTLGPDFNPITPMIIISNGGGYSDSMMTISIPVNVKQGDFAMAFLYDEKTGKLEGMPLLCSDGKKVVVATSNFSHSSATPFNDGAHARLNGETEEVDKIIISATNEKNLRGNYNSDFHPGVDDMSSKNEGSSYAPSGFCNGQTEAMMWYYVMKRQPKNEPSLFHLLDNDGGTPTPKFWRDDTKAVKLASVLQNDFTLSGVFRLLIFGAELGFGSILTDRVTMNAFAYAIKLIHEPQYVGIYSNSTFPPAGHAMVLVIAILSAIPSDGIVPPRGQSLSL